MAASASASGTASDPLSAVYDDKDGAAAAAATIEDANVDDEDAPSGDESAALPPPPPPPVGDAPIPAGAVVEAWLNGRLRLGVVTEATPTGVLARLAADAPLPSSPPAAAATPVSRGELVAVWPPTLAPDVPADGGAAAILDGARTLLRSTPPRALSLDHVYAAARAFKKGDPRGVVTAAAVARELFPPGGGRRRPAAAVDATPATATAAAALLLAADGLRWKRAPGGGWRALPPSVVSTRGTGSFVSAARVAADAHSTASAMAEASGSPGKVAVAAATVPSSSSAGMLSRAGVKALWKRQHLDIVRALEIAAASDAVPRGAGAAAMTGLGYTPTAAEAARLLRDIGFCVMSGWTFPPDVLDEARRLRAAARRRRSGFATGATAVGRGRRNCLPSRGGVWAVDDPAARFLDDAFTIRRVRAKSVADRDVWRVTVHIADVDAVVGAGTAMDTLACERGESLYLPARPLHMLPAAAMEGAGFSKELPTETVAVQMDVDVGTRTLVDWDVFLGVVGPVRRLTYDGLNAALSDARKAPRSSVRLDEDGATTSEGSASGELRALAAVADGPGATATPTITPFRRTRAHTTVSTLLSTAGGLFRRHATSVGVPLPERPGASTHAARCGTAPLRRYADLVTQRQLKAALLSSIPSVPRRSPLGRRRIASLRTWLERRHVESGRLVAERRRAALYDAFAGACEAQVAAAGGGTASVEGIVRRVDPVGFVVTGEVVEVL
ncbi:hypothetical protein I4F81_007130 [Pyropia yezoensis]|uniref:Uncharacterized protein n=1 Tax=Pyropia yezoensis TaxID=2788 RepID=A0ACC3C309_PYRYE|nr:hypothetical protein I4F81_007130 [Neopyropia yezoensis]